MASVNFGEVALKIDIGKTFDKVDWNYLLNVMKKMEFDEKWLGSIYLHLHTVPFLYFVNINGGSKG